MAQLRLRRGSEPVNFDPTQIDSASTRLRPSNELVLWCTHICRTPSGRVPDGLDGNALKTRSKIALTTLRCLVCCPKMRRSMSYAPSGAAESPAVERQRKHLGRRPDPSLQAADVKKQRNFSKRTSINSVQQTPHLESAGYNGRARAKELCMGALIQGRFRVHQRADHNFRALSVRLTSKDTDYYCHRSKRKKVDPSRSLPYRAERAFIKDLANCKGDAKWLEAMLKEDLALLQVNANTKPRSNSLGQAISSIGRFSSDPLHRSRKGQIKGVTL
jgi:hypothetical protein